MGYNEFIVIINASAILVLMLLAMLLLVTTKFKGENAYAAAIIVLTTIPAYLYNTCRSEQWYEAAAWFAPFSYSVNTMLMPLLWLFVYRNFNRQFRFTPRQYLHFIPTAVALAVYLIYTFSLPTSDRFDFMIYENTGDDMWLGDINAAIVFIQMFVYFTIIFVYLIRVKRLIGDNLSETEWMYNLWIPKFIMLFAGLFFVVFVGYTLWPRTDAWLPQILNVIAMCYLVYHALIGIRISQLQSLSIEDIQVENGEKTTIEPNNLGQLKEYAEQILDYLQTTQAYTNPQLTLRDLSTATGISYNNLSKAINTIIGKNFFEMVNHMRIEKAKFMLPSYKENNYTLDTLAEMCGFNSRAVFSSAFKKSTGMTTSQWLQMHQNK
ncbi:MAG: AraC family transcriptional regulator [Bacteroidales bacterium]|nr:AraC family transcriptional regulator [Bacteroidales bacterium]